MRPDEVAGTECQSRLDEDAVHRERPGADAADRVEPALVFRVQELKVQQLQAAAVLPVLAAPDDAALPEVQAVRMQQRARALPFSEELRLQPARLLRAPVFFLPEVGQRGDAT
jgi:hypothetical protein